MEEGSSARDVFEPVVQRHIREQATNQSEADVEAGRLAAIERLCGELTSGPLLDEPLQLLDVMREHQSMRDQWEAFRNLAAREGDPLRKRVLEGELEALRVGYQQKAEQIRDLLLDAETARRFTLLAALMKQDEAGLFVGP